jgi:glycosyltransferase involved in cell wall biosynthesis
MFDISLIIPVFNTEAYLSRCLNSILRQEFTGTFEVIVLEACSTDKSLEKLKGYEENYNNFKLVRHPQRVPLSTSRIVGMNLARGNYIMHVDSDDWILPESLQMIYNELISFPDVDVHVFNYITTDLNSKVKYNKIITREIVTNEKERVKKYFLSTVWNKVVKRDLLHDLLYGNYPVTIEEDLIYSSEILSKAKRIRLSKSIFYSYFDNFSSLTKTIKPIEYLEMRSHQLAVLKKIFYKYNCSDNFVKFVLHYFEKGIYIQLTRAHLFGDSMSSSFVLQLKMLREIGLLSDNSIRKIELSINNKLISYLNFIKLIGIRHFLGLLKIKLFKKLYLIILLLELTS